MVKTESEPVSEEELEEESDIEEIIEKDGLNSVNVTPDDTNYDSETYIGAPAEEEEEKTANNKSYIQQRKSYNMTNVDKNKLLHTRIGDHINYFDNGRQDSGIVTKMSSSFLTIVKEDGIVHDVHINDTFFVSDILLNKTWNDMDMEEKTEQLMKVHAYSPRYLSKTWEQLPKELRDVMKIVDQKIQTGAKEFLEKPAAGAGAKEFLEKPSLQQSASTSLKPSRAGAGFKKNRALGKDADGGTVTTGTEGTNNIVYNTKKPHEPLGKTVSYKLKGIPEDIGNSWGIKYINKDEEIE
tara:strand:+ start:449 stop:1336 length:888 start_codon:yes stop_codon:yes gene_type:complete